MRNTKPTTRLLRPAALCLMAAGAQGYLYGHWSGRATATSVEYSRSHRSSAPIGLEFGPVGDGRSGWISGGGIRRSRHGEAAVMADAGRRPNVSLRMMGESGAPPAKKGKGKGPYKVIANNKKARRNYEILEKFEAGIELVGSEVKSCRMSKINMDEGFAQAKRGQCFLHGVHIAECGVSNRFYQHEPRRPRRLLLHKREIKKLEDKVAQKGMTVVPLKIFFNDSNRLKVEIGLALGKNVRDKREDIKSREAKRDMQRIAKNAYD